MCALYIRYLPLLQCDIYPNIGANLPVTILQILGARQHFSSRLTRMELFTNKSKNLERDNFLNMMENEFLKTLQGRRINLVSIIQKSTKINYQLNGSPSENGVCSRSSTHFLLTCILYCECE